MTLEDIAKIPKNMLVPTDVSKFLGVGDHSIRLQAQQDPESLGFPVIVMGTRTLIPKEGFIFFCKYGKLTTSETVKFIEDAIILREEES